MTKPPASSGTQESSSSRPIDVDYYLSVDEGNNGNFMLRKMKEDDRNKSSTSLGSPRSLIRELFDYFRYRSWKKKLLTVILVLVCVVVFYDLIFGNVIRTWLTSFLEWMSANSVLAVFAFIGIFIVSTLIFIPPSILIFGAGFCFTESSQGNIILGVCSATIACFVGSCIGAVIAFYRARYMMRDLVHLFAKRYPLVRAYDKAFKRNGFRVMLLLRLCPLIPFNGLNYIGGITGVKWEEFTLALVGILPWTVLMVAIGATAGSLAMAASNAASVDADNEYDDDKATYEGWSSYHQIIASVLLGSGLAFGVIAMIVVWYFAKKELEKEMETDEKTEAIQEVLDVQSPEPDKKEPKLDAIEANANGSLHYDGSDDEKDGVEASFQEGVDDEEWFWIWA